MIPLLTGALVGTACYIALTVAGKKEVPWRSVTAYWLLVTAYWFLRGMGV